MPINDLVRVHHMLESAREAFEFADGKTLSDLQADRMRTLALIRCFEVIGEAATSVTPEFKAAHPSLPWRVMAAIRNRLIHAYFDVDLAVVLETAQRDLPPVIAELETILADEGEGA